MSALQVIFILTALVTLYAAVQVVCQRKLMHAAFWLIGVLLGVAIIFATLGSRFFAVVEVLVYIGAISILIIFAVMLTRKVMDENETQMNRWWGVAFVPAIGLFAGLAFVLWQWTSFSTTVRTVPFGGEDVTAFGLAMVAPDKFLVPFEISSVLLIAALIGAIYVAAERRGGSGR
jgi:NADH-quinone oxidoreductase subunit J